MNWLRSFIILHFDLEYWSVTEFGQEVNKDALDNDELQLHLRFFLGHEGSHILDFFAFVNDFDVVWETTKVLGPIERFAPNA